MPIASLPMLRPHRAAWNKGRIVGQKRPLLPKHVWAIRVRLELADNVRELALFNMAVDSKLRGCDLVRLLAVFNAMLATSTDYRHSTPIWLQLPASPGAVPAVLVRA